MTNKLSKQYNYAKMSVLNVKSMKVTNGENKDNFPLQVSPKGVGIIHFVKSHVIQSVNWIVARDTLIQPWNLRRARDAGWELEGST